MTACVQALHDVVPGSHACWVVDADDDFHAAGLEFLGRAAETGEKAVYFGPRDSEPYRALRNEVALAADPRLDFLSGGTLDPAAMFRMFADTTAAARTEGHRGLRLLADMDWLLPLGPTADDIVGFELRLDREARSLGATIVCAYRSRSFDVPAITGAGCVHPVTVGERHQPEFRLVADERGWRLSGEVDLVTADLFQSAITTAVAGGDSVVDASGLEFIDVAGMRAFARAARSARGVRVVDAPAAVRRCWCAASFDQLAPNVEFVADGR